MEYKDYYQILGVDKKAGQDEIKNAFRKLAKQYHPDKTKGDKAAETKFKEVNEAYEVLKDPEKRKKYDEVGENWKYYQQAGGAQGGGFDWSQYASPGGGSRSYRYEGDFSDFFGGGSSGFSDFFDTLFGGGGGFSNMGGRRAARQSAQMKGQDYNAELNISLEDAYNGGEKNFMLEGQQIKLKIKPGIEDGKVLKLPGKGGAGVNGGQGGDLYLKINVEKDPVFERRGNDLYADMPVDLYNAVLGGKQEFRTLKGSIKINIPAGSSSGKVLKLGGLGMPVYGKPNQHGDLYAKIMVQVPQNLSEKQKELFEELQKIR
jgi:curved DNA-binding protein